jgi:hypothetical protein
MKIFIAILIIGIISGLICLSSCLKINPGPQCGPFDNRFLSTGLSINTLKIRSYDSLTGRFDFAYLNLLDTIPYEKLTLRLMSEKKFYIATSLHQRCTFSIFSEAYACSPPIPYSDEKVDNIIIKSNKDYDQTHISGDNLADLFEIVIVDNFNSIHNNRMSLKAFLALRPNTKDELYLLLTKAPEKTDDFIFQIQYIRTLGTDQKEFLVNSLNVYIPKE